ncbi:hypothetical protein RGR602_CH00118 [Rhizobium gallicum bv. gallicum R602sp]|uniref:Uncharacterized protein n=1 Tax=Rhizobium gallicum bv. gallicum R602sp TaxID=1041138 RepID=A0A0B4WYV4_9HYPH|nr:hypothetical protein RGR602_CH00118 [Rhizobium gallicum bv. gallicum R602sp]
MDWQKRRAKNRTTETKKAGTARFSASGLAGHPVPVLPVHPWSAPAPVEAKGIIPFSSGRNPKAAHAGLLVIVSKSSR